MEFLFFIHIHMKKTILLAGMLLFILILSGCGEKERISELENKNYEYQREISNLKNTIEDCNNNISDARSYIGESYEDMEYALDSLEDCEY